MKKPKQFLDLSLLDRIVWHGQTLYNADQAIHQAKVMSGKTGQSLSYHKRKLMANYGRFSRVEINKPRSKVKGVLSAVPSDAPKLAEPGDYVEPNLLYRLLFLSSDQDAKLMVEAVETEVTPSIFERGWYICDGLTPEQISSLKTTVAKL